MAENEEASPICRGKNLSWETVMLFYNYMPKKPMSKNDFNSFVEANINGWTQTHSQIARQLAFYYEENGICYPRFNNASTLADLFNYIVHWAHNYFIPNPYAPSLKGNTPTSIYSHLAKCIREGYSDFDMALDSLFDIPLSSHDKVRVYLQNYTNIKFNEGKISLNDSLIDNCSILTPTELAATNTKEYFLYFGDTQSQVQSRKQKYSLQQIYYGAPGTGKSHKIKESICNMPADNVFRTTFHPDSDYSTFVGCYKPTKIKASSAVQQIVDYSTLVDILNQRMNATSANITKECVTFGYEYHDSIVKMQDNNAHTIPGLVTDAYKPGSTFDTQVRAGMAVYETYGGSVKKSDSITYSFVPQTFLKAYTRAYQTTEPVVLIIEEINRGNCAQIFGDLFQLLDRNEKGCSEYPIKADEDLCAYLKERLGEDSEGIANDELRLPNNLYIWATMNTSDQSLFPIDSAFKRRWDWKYVPIANKDKNYKIEAAGQLYDWWDFLDKVNTAIGELTSSEDKKLGYFFCKADEDNIISADKFVSKVLFYLYNDVLKDYEADDVIFNYKDESYTLLKYQDGDKQSNFKFSQFFDENGDALEDMVAKFLENINVENSFVDDSSQKSIDGEDGKNDSSLKPKRRKFWQGYIDATKNNTEYLKVYSSDRTAGSQTFMDLAFGKSLYHPYMVCSFDKSLVRCGIWINKSDKTDEVFELFKTNESKMNSLVGTDMVFNKNEKTGSIYTEISINLHDENKWAEAYLWLMNMALKMKDIKDAFGI